MAAPASLEQGWSKSLQLLADKVGEENITKSEDEFHRVLKTTYARMHSVEKQIRRVQVIAKRNTRSLNHLQHFIHIKIRIANQSGTNFELMVDKRQTIEHLSHQIEAEYAHRVVIPGMSEDGASLVDPLTCGALYDSEKKLLKFSELISDVLDVESEVLVINTNHGRIEPDDLCASISVINNIKADEMLQRIFSNKIALELFHEFCVEAYAAEHFLFWIAVASYDDVPQKERSVFLTYIFKTFLDKGAPLRINVGNDMLLDIEAAKESSTSIEPDIFDEVQEEVYALFVCHLFPAFEESPYMEVLKQQQQNLTHYRKNTMFDTVYDVFKPSIKDISELCASINGSHIEKNYAFRHKILQKNILIFFPQSKHKDISSYFSDHTQMTAAQRKRQIGKGKKIAKFFGEHISHQAMQNQMKNSRPVEILDQSLKALNLNRDVSSDTMESHDSAVDRRLETLMRKKKMEKLSAFFGQAPAELYGSDELPGQEELSRDDISKNEPSGTTYVPPTLNDLSPTQKMLLLKRRKKIQSVFGENLDEHMAFKLASGCRPARQEQIITEHRATLLKRSSSDFDVNNTKLSDKLLKDIPILVVEENNKLMPARARTRSASFNSVTSRGTPPVSEREVVRKKFSKLSSVLGDPLIKLGDQESPAYIGEDRKRRKSSKG